MYAIIQTGGKQYKVAKDNVLFVEKLSANEKETVSFDVVAVYVDDEGLKIGDPFVEGAKVEGKILKNGKGKKITVFTYKPKKNVKRKMGHRQPYSQVAITEISFKGVSAKSDDKDSKKGKEAKKPEKKAAKAKTEKKPVKKAAETKTEKKPVKKATETKTEKKPVKKAAETKTEKKPAKKAAETKTEKKPVKKAASKKDTAEKTEENQK